MELKDTIKRLREERGLTQEELAKALGVTRPAVTQWETGWSQPRMGTIEKLSQFFGVSKAELIEGGPRPAALNPRRMVSGGPARLPVRRLGSVHAGAPADEEEADGSSMVPEDVARRHPRGFVLRVEGDCMDNVIPEGYDVVVDPDAEPSNGSVVVVEMPDGRAVMRRWLRGGQTLVLAADSHAEHDDIVVRWDDGPVRVVGRVVWSQREV